jgi:hypothetical protein
MNTIGKSVTALTVSWLAAGIVTSSVAGPLPTMTAAVTQAAPDHAIDVYWRGYGWRSGYGWRGYGPGRGLGLAAGVLAGAAIAAPYYGGRSYYYGAPVPYFYSRPVYAAPYAYAPVYAPPVYSGYAPYGYSYDYPGRCYTNEGYGRYRSCSAN